MPELPILSPIANAPLSVVLLARDDSAHLETVTASWVTHLNGLGQEFEVILVDDGSRDGSAEKLTAISERHPHMRVLRHDIPRGEGATLAMGLSAAKYPLVVYCRCEPRYQPSDLRKLLREIDKVHLVSGYRAGQPFPRSIVLLGRIYRTLCRVIFSHAPTQSAGWLGWKRYFGRWLVRAGFGVRSRDVACPYRLLRREILARIPLQSRGSFVHVELLAKANFLGHLIAEEVPLGDRQRPLLPEELRYERLRDVLRDARRVFSQPDFGRAHLDDPGVPSSSPSDRTGEIEPNLPVEVGNLFPPEGPDDKFSGG
jgi:glycosyltransferase involved in cell wall biosynthesis